ncbi:MAG: pyruvate dehydrogenase complex dihydrolipoamide acetyltransferase [Bauldia sp.]
MAIDILMPALSPTMEEGVLAKWHVKEGDRVAPGDVIAEIETDKATMEVEAVDEGTVARIVVPEGTENVKVNAVIAVLNAEGDPPAPPAAPPALAAASAASPVPDRHPPAPPAPAVRPPCANGGRLFASPLARRLAQESGIDLSSIKGTGPQGRIVSADLAGAAEAAPRPAQPPPAEAAQLAGPKAAATTDAHLDALYPPDSYRLQPHDNIRRIIARRLTESKQTVPHFYLTVDTEIDALLKLRADINAAAPVGEDGKPVWRVSVNDMIIKAMALALVAVPDANATWSEQGMLLHKHADIGVAVAIPGGLITPVVRQADRKPLSQISNEMKDYAARARERKLKPEEYQGGSTSISNLGMYGVREFAAVINPPQSSILAVGAGSERTVVRSGKIEIATVMTVTLSSDHRAVDGAVAAELMKAFRRNIEKPAGMLV